MHIIETALSGVVILEPKAFEDERGFFMESYNRSTLEKLGLFFDMVQDNHSLSVPVGTIRGLHYQLNPRAQTKLVRVLEGAVYDVVVDLRKSSNTYGRWIGVILSETNKRQLLVPKGFAHGICTIVPNTQLLYKVDEYYSPEHDRGIRWDDPDLNIIWPTSQPVLSEKDKQQPLFKDAEMNF